MPVQYRFDADLIIVELIGEYSLEDIRSTLLNSLEDSKRPKDAFLLVDLTDAQSIFKRTADDIRGMSRFVEKLSYRFNYHVAFVAPEDLPFGFMRLGIVGAEEKGIEAKVFRTFSEAKKWLLSLHDSPA